MRAIITYHSIDDSGSVISVDVSTFEDHLRSLSTRVRLATVDEVLEAGEDEDVAALTFDDGFRNFAEHAWPRLADAGAPATLFVVTGRMGGTNRWRGDGAHGLPELPLLDWEATATLAGQGVRIESHTRTHPRLAGLEASRLADEIERSAEEIERNTGRRPVGLAYPYGSLDGAAVATAARAYRWACTTRLAHLESGTDRHRLPRLDAYYYRRPGALDDWGSPLFRARVRARAGARGVKARLAALGPERSE